MEMSVTEMIVTLRKWGHSDKAIGLAMNDVSRRMPDHYFKEKCKPSPEAQQRLHDYYNLHARLRYGG